MDEVRRLLESALIGNASSYSGHSFQIGAATSVAMAGAPDWQIRAMGRWKSDFVLRYVRHDPSATKGLAKLLTSSLTTHVRIVAYTLCQTNKLNSKPVTAELPSWGRVTAAHFFIAWGACILAHGWLSGYGQSYPIDTAWVTGCRRLLGSPLVHTRPRSPPAHTQLTLISWAAYALWRTPSSTSSLSCQPYPVHSQPRTRSIPHNPCSLCIV